MASGFPPTPGSPDHAVAMRSTALQPERIAVSSSHGENLYTYYAHMRPSGMKVGIGDQVLAGDPLGEVGNSGDSVEPQLHFHAMSGPDPGLGPGIPALFENWISGAYGRRVLDQELGTIRRGDFVESLR